MVLIAICKKMIIRSKFRALPHYLIKIVQSMPCFLSVTKNWFKTLCWLVYVSFCYFPVIVVVTVGINNIIKLGLFPDKLSFSWYVTCWDNETVLGDILCSERVNFGLKNSDQTNVIRKNTKYQLFSVCFALNCAKRLINERLNLLETFKPKF